MTNDELRERAAQGLKLAIERIQEVRDHPERIDKGLIDFARSFSSDNLGDDEGSPGLDPSLWEGHAALGRWLITMENGLAEKELEQLWIIAYQDLYKAMEGMRRPRSEVEELLPEELKAILPKDHISPSTKISNMFADILSGKGEQMDVQVGSKKKEIITVAAADLRDADGLTICGEYTEFDRDIDDAAASLYLYGNDTHNFTPLMLYRTMTGDYSARPRKSTLDDIIAAIEKHRKIHAYIDFHDEGIARKYNVSEFKLDDYLLSVRGAEFMQKGKRVNGYHFNAKPLLLEYAEMSGQIQTYPAHLLDVKEMAVGGDILDASMSNTTQRIMIKNYLLRRVAVMKHDHKKAQDKYVRYNNRRQKNPELDKKGLSDHLSVETRIMYDAIFSAAGLTDISRQVALDQKMYITQCLRYWKAVGHIKDFHLIRDPKRSAEIGVQIIL